MNKESIIEFLKPDWRKILLVVIIFVLFPVPVHVQSAGCSTELTFVWFPVPVYVPRAECCTEALCAVYEEYWTIMFFGLSLFDIILQGPIFSFEYVALLSFFIVSSYLLSCLIVYFYDKFKPLNKKFKQ